MPSYPPVAQVRVLTNRVVTVVISRTNQIYARSGIIDIGAGEIEVEVEFPTPLPSTDYTVPALQVNSQDLPDPFITARVSSILSQTGFTVRLSSPTLSASMKLHWAIAELYNP